MAKWFRVEGRRSAQRAGDHPIRDGYCGLLHLYYPRRKEGSFPDLVCKLGFLRGEKV